MIERIQIGQLPIDAVDLQGALGAIETLVKSGGGGTVFTPNVDHVVLVESDERFRRAYQQVSLSLVDGTPVLWAAQLLGHPLPEKVSGSDLVVPLMERAAARGWRVFMLGGGPGSAETAVARLREQFPRLNVVGVEAPRIDIESAPEDRRAIATRVAAAKPDLVLAALGSPKQEIFCDETRDVLRPAVLVGVGAGLDFIAGVSRRAPAWMSRAGIEWLYRLAHEPRRLAGRYLLRDPQFIGILLRQLLRRSPADIHSQS